MEETTIWQDIWDHIYNVYLSVDGSYENLGYGSNTMISIRLVVLGIFIGLVIACVAMAYNKQVLGGFVRRLLSSEIKSAESAKTLSELGYEKNPFIRGAVRKSVSLRRVVRCVEEDEFYAHQNADREAYDQRREQSPELPKFKEQEYLVDPSADHFYIPEEKKYSAEMRFEAKGTSWGVLALIAVVAVVGCIALLFVIPNILQLVNEFMGMFDPQNKIY